MIEKPARTPEQDGTAFLPAAVIWREKPARDDVRQLRGQLFPEVAPGRTPAGLEADARPGGRGGMIARPVPGRVCGG